MEWLDNLALGFSVALSWQSLSYALIGCLVGTLIGILPGLGPVPTIAMLLPVTYGLPPTAALIMLASIYYGAQYGGSTTAILLKLPGESSSAVTVIDGHAMARKGRAGAALAAAAIGSFVAGSVGILLLAGLAIPLTEVAFRFGPAEYFSLMLLGLVGSIALSPDSIDKSLGLMVIGLLLSLVGTDINSGAVRFAAGAADLMDGIEMTALAMGVFGIAEIAANLETRKASQSPVALAKVSGLWPSRIELRRMAPAIARGTAIGSLLGVLPGAGVTIASFAAYTLEKKFSRHAHEMGSGAIEGVAGPESANNAAAQTNFVSLLTLGIPGSPTMALMLGAMVIHNIQPGPQVISSHPEIFWGLIASMWIGNLMLLVLNLPLVGVWVKLLSVPYRFLFPAILVFCSVGAFSVRGSIFDVYLLAAFGVFGYGLVKLALSPVPLLLGFVLGPMLEASFRRTLMVSGGDFSVFFTRSLSLALLALALALVIVAILPGIRNRRAVALAE
ncbi:MAG: tripartite tricarboxylate transporter permease [Pollutimonas bauzanensis]|uniref:TctA family transporter n=1 Tax=Pollutimonas bauzanensis TaxID=658167 RepID=A0A1M5NI07_9BURK|nr:tripartite tricarboxylate transporter permease [Pollutimonas bauzanensis]SHG89206.1 TctA family transporter [Pollutimonas bauzanensis]